jgi:antitoxin component of MazEF toxin-antitoxin module
MFKHMPEIITRTRKWGNSLGIILPKKTGFRPGEKVRVHIERAEHVTTAGELFGTMTFKKSTEQMLRETDAELWPDE